jgi:hypothetical protein
MANPNPHAARLAKRRAHKPLDLLDVLKIMTKAIREAEAAMLTTTEVDLSLRCVHALSQACGQYAKLLEIGEFEARLKALEDAKDRRNGHAI